MAREVRSDKPLEVTIYVNDPDGGIGWKQSGVGFVIMTQDDASDTNDVRVDWVTDEYGYFYYMENYDG